MSYFFDVDLVAEHIKNIADYNRCVICDRPDGSRVRFGCGHTACNVCVSSGSQDCMLCLTLPISSQTNVTPDGPLTNRVKNSCDLVKNFQDNFGVNVYKRQRISEQLKVERELFPECIQAPVKYSNKRKSTNILLKENKKLSFLPGELTTPIKDPKMEKSNYVQQWLNRNEKILLQSSPRKPLTDLSVNTNSHGVRHKIPTLIKKRADIILEKAHENSENVYNNQSNRKRTHFKTSLSLVENQSLLDKYVKPVENSFGERKKIKKLFNDYDKKPCKALNKKDEKDESGIEIDEELVVIDDSQSQVIDKDHLAWLAVLEANENDTCTSINFGLDRKIFPNVVDITLKKSNVQNTETFNNTNGSNVPFYKKSYLVETCKLCDDSANKNEVVTNETTGQCKDVSITIENDSFITTIKVSNRLQNYSKAPIKNTIPVQTDIKGLFDIDVENLGHKPDTDIPHIPDTKIADDKNTNHIINEKSYEIDLKTKSKVEEVHSLDMFADNADSLKKRKDHIFETTSGEVFKHSYSKNEAKNIVIADSDSDEATNQSSIIQVTAEVHRSNDQLDYGILTELDDYELGLRKKRVCRGLTPTSSNSSDKENFDPNKAKRPKVGKKNKKANRKIR